MISVWSRRRPSNNEGNAKREDAKFAFLPRTARRRSLLRLFDEPRKVGAQFRVKFWINASPLRCADRATG